MGAAIGANARLPLRCAERAAYARAVGHSDPDRLQELEERHRPHAIEAPEQEQSPVTRLASQIGNRGLASVISRMREGEGILPGGTVHPDVEATIASERGRGQPLPDHLAARFERAFGGPVRDVQVHTGATADALARSVQARAFATGTDIFFAHGEYRPGTPAGDELIGHEVAHTEQQRGAPLVGPLVVSQPGDALEREADSIARDALA